MATTAKYLQELVNQKNRLVDFLNSKGIEASKENTFNQLINSVETMPGGVVELDELHKPVPNSGYVEKVYFNTNLSVDEVVKVLDRLEYTEVLNGKMYGILYVNEGETQISLFATKIEDYIYAIQEGITGTTIFTSANYSGIDFIGWNPNLENGFEINNNVLDNVGSILNVGEQNDLLVTLVSTTPFKKGEGVEGELYKLKPTGTVVPESGLIEKVYINQYLDSAGMINILKKISYPNLPGFGEVYPFIVNSDMSKKVAVIAERTDGEITLYRIVCDESSLWGGSLLDNTGYWNSAEPIIELEIGYENAFSMLAPMFGVPSQNELLKDLFSITPFEVKYYTIRDGQYVELTEGGSGESGCVISKPTWEDVLPYNLSRNNSLYTYIAKNGIDMYSYNNVSGGWAGIYHRNLQTGLETQVYATGYGWSYWFEDSKGNVYVSSNNSSSKGLLSLSGATATLLISSNYNWKYFFEDSKGNVYVSSSDYGSGLYYLNVSTSTKLNSTYNWKYFFEDSKGNVYVSSSESYTGILYLNGEIATKVYGSDYYWEYFFEDSKGNVYVGGNSSSNGIVHLNGTIATKIYDVNKNWHYFFEDNNGNVYAGSANSSTGIVHINGTTATQIYTTGTSFGNFFEDSKGNVYVSSLNSSSTGIVHIDTTTLTTTQIYTDGYYYNNWFEDSKGNVYTSCSTNFNGLYHINNLTVTKIYETGTYWKYFFEDSKGNVYASSSNGNTGILYLSGATATLIKETGGGYEYFFEDSKGNVYVNGIYSGSYLTLLNGEMATQLASNYSLPYYFEHNNGIIYVARQETPTSDNWLYIIENGVATLVYYIEV